jgi:hypothetical protein
MICGGEVQILLINLGPLRCFMFTRMEHSGEGIHRRSTEGSHMAVVLQFTPCLYELQRFVISVYDRLFPHNVMFTFTTSLYNGIHFLVIGGIFLDSIKECIIIVCHWMPMLSEN